MAKRRGLVGALVVRQARDLDERVGLAAAARYALNYVFPDNWSFMLGEVALYSFMILVLTGVYLTFFFTDSSRDVVYHGAYVPLRGVSMSEAFESVMSLSFAVKAGLVVRQMHHWAAHLFIGAIGVHMCRIFFTGAFRRPRELNWSIGLMLSLLAVVNGFFGYSLPDDLLSGTGLRIGYSITESIPFVGTWLAYWLWGGNFPGNAILERMYVLHVFVLPILIAGLIGAHLTLIVRQHHTQFPGPHKTEENVVGTSMWPAYAARSLGFFCMAFAVIGGLGGLAQINPIWHYGPYDPYRVSSLSQPDWYVGWVEGAMRLMPSWETHFPGHMVANPFWPAVFLPVGLFGLLLSWPFLESAITRDRAHHNLLDRPRDRPVRTAVGAGLLTFFFVLLLAGGDDVILLFVSVNLEVIVWALRVSAVVLPLIVAGATYLLCKELSGVTDAQRKAPPVAVRYVDGGGYTLVPDPGAERDGSEPAPMPAEEATGDKLGR